MKLRHLLFGRKIYDQSRQLIKKQRHYFINESPSIQTYGLSSSHVWMWELDYKESWVPKMLLKCGVREDSWKSLGLQGDPTSPFWRRSVLNIHWRDWCWSWNSNTSASWCEELTHLKRPWCWERLWAGGEGDDRGWDGWISQTQWLWVWANPRRWWRTGKSGVLQSMGSLWVGHNLVAEQQQHIEYNSLYYMVGHCCLSIFYIILCIYFL